MNYMKISKPKKSCINDFNEFIKNLKMKKNYNLEQHLFFMTSLKTAVA